MSSEPLITQIHSAFGNAENTIIRAEILNQFTGLVDSEVKTFYSKFGKKSWLEFTDEDLEEISSEPDVRFYYSAYPMLFILPAFMIKSIQALEQPEFAEYCESRDYVFYELNAMTATREEFRQQLLEAGYIPKDMVEFYLEKDVKGGQEKREALTAKQKAACAAYLHYVVDRFEKILPQLKGAPDYDALETECLRATALRERFDRLLRCQIN